MRSRAKQGQSGVRYRVDADGFAVHEESKRGRRKRLLRAATAERIRLEQEFRRENGVDGIRLEEHHAIALYAKLPSVHQIAKKLRAVA